MANVRRVITEADSIFEGETMAAIAFGFLRVHADVLTRLGIWYRVRIDSDDEAISRCELVDGADNVVAAVTLTVGVNGLTTLAGECQLSATLHECPNDILTALS